MVRRGNGYNVPNYEKHPASFDPGEICKGGGVEQLRLLGKKLPPLDPARHSPDPEWKQCRRAFLDEALARALALPSGGWCVVDAAAAINDKQRLYQIDGRQLLARRMDGELLTDPYACPHLAGPLADGRVESDRLVCPWHGLELSQEGHGTADSTALSQRLDQRGDAARDSLRSRGPHRQLPGSLARGFTSTPASSPAWWSQR